MQSEKKTSELLANFKFVRVLGQQAESKAIAILGTVDSQNCIVRLEKLNFAEKDAALLAQSVESLQAIEQNDIYRQLLGHMKGLDVKIDIVYPASDAHILKHSLQERVIVTETPTAYYKITLPYILSIPKAKTAWVQNIIDGTKETESVIFRDEEMLILPDAKWDRTTQAKMYLLALTVQPIRSLRELNGTHLPLLKSIRDKIRAVSLEKFGVPANKMRLFVHYQPTYYHFHVHAAALGVENSGLYVGQSHLLDDIIENISMMDDYYQKRTFAFALGVEHPLVALMSTNKD